MSFQGDVAGIGLGELLQGLARGGRDGVLTLYGERENACIGLRKSRIYLIASEGETDFWWRDRCQRAWAKDPDPRVESQRRERIARSARLETIYQMLEAANLHFRFEPGPLPLRPGQFRPGGEEGGGEAGGPSDAQMERAWGRGLTVEYLLLEHARLADESQSGPASTLAAWDLPRALDLSRSNPTEREFLTECDGNSTLLEIADRLGWTLTQCRHSAGEFLRHGAIRIAQPRELLAAAQRELELARAGRASARLNGWVRCSRPGPPTVEDANMLAAEWEKGRLQHVLPELEPRVARTLLRKLDLLQRDPRASRARWSALHEAHRGDLIAALRTATSRFTGSQAEPDTGAFHDLLQVARTFQDKGYGIRAAALLRLASSHMPSRATTRVELGKRMLDNGLLEEGTRWLLLTARELLDEGDVDRALIPLRSVLRHSPDDSSANGMLLQARALQAKRKRRRWQFMTSSSLLLILAMAGLVHLHSVRTRSQKIKEVEALLAQPQTAFAKLQQYFGEDPSERIGELRTRIILMIREEQSARYADWLEVFQEAEDLIAHDRLIEGLEQTVALPPAPEIDGNSEDELKSRTDLYALLMQRLNEESVAADAPVDASQDELEREARLLKVFDEIVARLDPTRVVGEDAVFVFSVIDLRDRIVARRATRAEEHMAHIERLRQQDESELYETAKAHVEHGDFGRAMQCYDLLLDRDPALRQVKSIMEEVELVRAQKTAREEATLLAENGQHAEALSIVRKRVTDPQQFTLPWRVDSRPGHARVTLNDGRVKSTPFVARSAAGQTLELTFVADGYVPRTVVVKDPGDLMINLFRAPERVWSERATVEASPVPVGDDHILCNRAGRIVRINAEGHVQWETRLETLGGIARTPLFLPARPGHLLVLSEDGVVWFVNATSGAQEGPYSVGSPPAAGPFVTRGGIGASFNDGRIAVWTSGLKPDFYPAKGMGLDRDQAPDDGVEHQATSVRISHHLTTQHTLVSPWTSWSVEVLPYEFLVRTPDGLGFSGERQGDWEFVQWEQPKAGLPWGRLWVSDQLGIRSYVPIDSFLVEQDGSAPAAPLGTPDRPSSAPASTGTRNGPGG